MFWSRFATLPFDKRTEEKVKVKPVTVLSGQVQLTNARRRVFDDERARRSGFADLWNETALGT